MKVRIQKNLFTGEYSDHIFHGSACLGELLNHYQCSMESQVFLNGEMITDLYTIADDGSFVVVREVPKGITGLVIGSIILGVIGIGGLILGGVMLHKALTANPSLQKIQTSPSLRGSTNAARKGGRLPILLGHWRIYPDHAALPYSRYADNNQFFVQQFCFGYSAVSLDLSTSKIGDTLITKYAGVQTNLVPSALYPERIIENQVGVELSNDGTATQIERTTSSGTTKINVGIVAPNGIFKYNGSNKEAATIGIKVDWRVPGGTWNVSANESLNLNVDKWRKMYEILPYGSSDGTYDVRVSRTNEAGTTTSYNDTIYFDILQSFTKNQNDNSTIPVISPNNLRLMAVDIQATDQLNGTIDSFNVEGTLRTRAWDGVASGASHWVDAETRNPAAAILYLLTNTKVNPRPIADTRIVWEEFEAFYQYCEDQGFHCDAWITSDYTIGQLIDLIAQSNMAEIRRSADSVGIMIDKINPYIAQMFTPVNAADFSMKKEFSSPTQVLNLKFVDASIGYEEAERNVSIVNDSIVFDRVLTDEDERTEISLFGVTDPDQVAKVGRYRLLEIARRKRTFSWSCDIEGILCARGDVVLLSNDKFMLGTGEGRIAEIVKNAEGLVTSIGLDTEVDLVVGNNYSIRIRTVDQILESYEIINNGGSKRLLQLKTPIYEPIMIGDLVAVGVMQKENLKVLVTEISQDTNRLCKISGIEYAEEIYLDASEIPAYQSGLSIVKSGTGLSTKTSLDRYPSRGPRGADGLPGSPARSIAIHCSSTIINLSSRGELKTQQIEITCLPSNLPIENAVWTATDEGSLSQIEISEGEYDPYKRLLDCSLVTGDTTLIQVLILYEGVTYRGVVGITKVSDGTPSPLYLDSLSTIPRLTSEGPLVIGDFFLYVGAYSGPGSAPGDQGLNPTYALVNEFIYGRIYEFKGRDANGIDQWQESRKSEHLAAAQKDALQIAKDTNTYLFVAVLVAQLGLFMDLLVAAALRSSNFKLYKITDPGYVSDPADEHYDTVLGEDGKYHAVGSIKSGFELDGVRGIIKALGLEAYSAMIYGNLEASGFRTLQEEPGTTIPVAAVSPTLWKHSEMESLITEQDALAALSGTIGGYSFTKATRRTNSRILLASHGYESESISAGETHYFTQLYPSKVFGLTFRCDFSGYYSGLYSNRGYWAFIAEANSDLTTAHFIRSMGESYTVTAPYSFPSSAYTNLTIKHYSGALWGNKGSNVDYHRVWTEQVFTGLVLVDGESSYRVIPFEPNAYYSNSEAWQIGSLTQFTIPNHYCSGTDFYDLFSALQVGADGFCDGGQINVNGQLYSVTRLTKSANAITFYTSGGVITVSKFQEGTSIGVYNVLAVTQAINFQAVVGGIEVKHIFPWGTQAGSPGTYDIGTTNERFNTAWLNYLDANRVNGFRVQAGNDTYPQGNGGSIPVVATDGGIEIGTYIDFHNAAEDFSKRLDVFNDYFNFSHKIVTPSVNTGHGDNVVYRNTYVSIYMTGYVQLGAMENGETRHIHVTTGGTSIKRLLLPAGYSYLVWGIYQIDDDDYGWGYTQFYSTALTPLSGGSAIIPQGYYDGGSPRWQFIVRRI